MMHLRNTLERYWFQPLPASGLALLRIATGCLSLWYVVSRYEALRKLPFNNLTMYEPVGLMQLLGTQPFSATVFDVLLWATIGFNILYILGWKFRYTGPLFAILLLLFFCYRNSWSMIYHNYNLLVLHIFIIGFAASADSFSVDAKLNRTNAIKSVSHWRYGWPVKLICFVTVITYFISGISKLTGNLDWDWISGEAMRSQVAVDSLRKNVMGEGSSLLFNSLYGYTWFFFSVGLTTIIVELGAPFILFNKRLVRLWVFLAFLMHWGIFFIMGIRFYHHMTGIVFLPFLEPEKWWNYLSKKNYRKRPFPVSGSTKEPSLVLFDGECNFCDSTVQFIISRDPKGQFHFASLQSEKGIAILTQYQLPKDLSTIVLIQDGRAYKQSTAVLRILKKLRTGWKWLCVLSILPAFIRNFIYSIIAKNRYRWFGQKKDCQIPSPEIRERFCTLSR